MSVPRYPHDCSSCLYLGQHAYEGEELDLYFCPGRIGGGTVIARFGRRPSEYGSFLWRYAEQVASGKPDHYYAVALRLAFERGLIRPTLLDNYYRLCDEMSRRREDAIHNNPVRDIYYDLAEEKRYLEDVEIERIRQG